MRRGFYDRKALTAREKKLESQYKQILNIATTEKSIAEGQSYDLMYVNPQLGGKQFAFLRGNDMLIAVNFAANAADTHITIPSHAFEFLGIKEGDVTATDLLTNKEQKITLAKDAAIKVSIPAYGGIVLKW